MCNIYKSVHRALENGGWSRLYRRLRRLRRQLNQLRPVRHPSQEACLGECLENKFIQNKALIYAKQYRIKLVSARICVHFGSFNNDVWIT